MDWKVSIVQKFKSGGLVLIDQAIVSGTSFITGILLARFLGLEVYGLFALLWMILLFGLSFSQAFVTKPLLSLQPQMKTTEAETYLAGLHTIQLIFSFLGVFFCVLGMTISEAVSIIDLPSQGILFKIPALLGLFLLYDFYRKSFFVKKEFAKALQIDGLLSGLQVSGIILLYFLESLSLESLLSLMIFTFGVICTLGFFRIARPKFKLELIHSVALKNFNFSKWLIGTAALQWLCGNFFIIASGGILGVAAVGAIRIVQNIIGLTHVIFLAMENIIPVYAAGQYKAGGFEKLYQFLRKVSLQTGSFVMLLLITLAAFSPLIIELLYGEEYVEFSYILVGFCLIYLLVFIGHPLRFALRTLELTKPIFISYVLGAIFSLITAYPLLHYFEMYGLLAGMFTTQLIAQLVYVFYLFKIKNTYENHPLGSRQG